MKKLILGMTLASAAMVSCGPKSVAVTGPNIPHPNNWLREKPSLKIPATDATNCRILQNTTIRAG
jgi:hypothetical protein